MQQRLQGRGDSPLTALGRRQARAHLAWLADLAPGRLLSSPLGRARATAALLAEDLALDVEYDPTLCERCMGELEGWTLTEIEAAYPHEHVARTADPWRWRPPGGENYDDLIARTVPLVARLREAPQPRLLVVSHGTLMRVLLGQLLDLSPAAVLRLLAPNDVGYVVDLSVPTRPGVRHVRDGRWRAGVLERDSQPRNIR